MSGSSGLTAGSTSYQYDLDGNRTRRTEGAVTTDYLYDRADQLQQQTIGATSRSFDYDRYGNLLQSADAASAYTTYAYDEASRLTGITPPSGGAVAFTLDALDRPATRTVGGSTSDTYGYLDGTETAWLTGTGTTTGALLDAAGTRLALKTGSQVSWLVFDLHGSVAGLCPAGTTALADAYRYDGWGRQVAKSGSSANPYRYRGLLNLGYDDLAGALLAMGAREYSSQLGVFTQEDSVAGGAANPATMNRFLYALANPATLIDPDGHMACLDVGTSCTTSGDLKTYVSTRQATAPLPRPFVAPRQAVNETGSCAPSCATSWQADACDTRCASQVKSGGLDPFLTRWGLGTGSPCQVAFNYQGQCISDVGGGPDPLVVIFVAGGLILLCVATCVPIAAGAATFLGLAPSIGVFNAGIAACGIACPAVGELAIGSCALAGACFGPEIPGLPQTYYPTRLGFLGQSEQVVLAVGTRFDRYGGTGGRWSSPAGTPIEMRALPPGTVEQPLITYEVLKPLGVDAGVATPWFGQVGLGGQYYMPASMQQLIDSGFIRIVGGGT